MHVLGFPGSNSRNIWEIKHRLFSLSFRDFRGYCKFTKPFHCRSYSQLETCNFWQEVNERAQDVSMNKTINLCAFTIVSRPLASVEHHCFGISTSRGKTREKEKNRHEEIQGVYGFNRFHKEKHLKEAVQSLYDQDCTQIGSYIYSSLLQGCVDIKALKEGKRVHAHMIKTGFEPGIFLQNRIIDMYGKCGKLVDARKVFDQMDTRDVFSWTTMIARYTKCGRMEYARELFDKMPERNVVSWNAMIAGYAQDGDGDEALRLFWKMQIAGVNPDHYVFASVLSACASLVAIDYGKQVHARMLRTGFEADVSVGNALVTMYAQCGNIDYARQLFDKMAEQDLVSWNAMIAGYVQHGHSEEVLKLLYQIKQSGMKPDHFTFASVLSACASSAALEHGKQVHAHIIKTGLESNVFVGSSLVDVYAKCENIEVACQVFQTMPKRNVVSWTAMVVGYAQNGQSEESLKLFSQMLQASEKPNQFTLTSALSACATLAAMEHGKQIHTQIIITGFESDVSVGNAIVTMYAKCGSIEDAHEVFNKMSCRNVVSWNTMVVGYAQHGHGKEALHLFEQMQQTGIKPNDITFMGVLSACNHAGLVDEGWHYLDSMSHYHHITPTADHYACMIDLLGRAGHLVEAQNFITNMPVKPNVNAWMALLGACRIHGNLELAKHAAEGLFELEPENDALYVLLSNIYVAAGRWAAAAKVRKMMNDRGVKKKPGYSWIEVKNKVHAFMAEDRSHPQKDEIYATLERLAGPMKEAGYVPDTKFGLQAVE
eukprot:Gb_31795 [translate_table: standard]